MKYIAIGLLLALIGWDNVRSFHESLYPSWGTKAEISQIINRSHVTNLPNRLLLFQKKKKSLYWHLQDSCIGIFFKVKSHQPLSWNFSLWDFCLQRGKGVNLAIIDQCCPDLHYKRGDFLKFDQKGSNFKRFDFLMQSYENERVCCSELMKKERIFSNPKKNVQPCHVAASIDLIYQIAPNCDCTIFGIMDEDGFAHSSDLHHVLQTIKSQDFDSIHLGLKLLHDEKKEALEFVCAKFPYIVAASGNDPLEMQEAYPASSKHVAFDVGSYDKHHNLCTFSQYEPSKGPQFVLPGKDLLCQFGSDQYMLASGTSMSAALMTGFVTLLLAEFKSCFTYNEIMNVVYQSAYILKESKSWKEKVVFGAIDMRTTLLCLHVLRRIKCHISQSQYNKLFSKLVHGILQLNKLLGNTDCATLQKLHKAFLGIAYKRDFNDYIELFTECILKSYGLKMKKCKFKVLFDNHTVCLLRNSIKLTEYIPSKTLSEQAKQKMQHILHRKT